MLSTGQNRVGILTETVEVYFLPLGLFSITFLFASKKEQRGIILFLNQFSLFIEQLMFRPLMLSSVRMQNYCLYFNVC